MLGDPNFWDAVGRTVSFSVMSVVAIAVVALACALLLNQEFRGRRILSAALLVPWAIPYVAHGLMWKWIYDSNYGALNGALLQLDLIDTYMVWPGGRKSVVPATSGSVRVDLGGRRRIKKKNHKCTNIYTK